MVHATRSERKKYDVISLSLWHILHHITHTPRRGRASPGGRGVKGVRQVGQVCDTLQGYLPTYLRWKGKRQLNKPLTCLTVCGSFSHTQFWAMYVSISDAMAAAGGYESWSCSHMSSRTQPARQCTLLTSLFEWNRVVMEAAMFMWMEV